MKSISRASTTDMLLLIFIAVVWASAFIAIKVAVPEVGPLWLATIRVGIGAIVLAPYALYRGLMLPRSGKVWSLVVVMAILNVVVPFFLISWAELTIDAGVTSLLMGVGPFLALIGSHIFTRDDKINPRKALGVAFGFAGVLVLVGIDAVNQLGGQHLTAQLAALGGSLCYVTAGIIIRHIDIPPTRLAFLALFIGTAILLPSAMLFASPIAAWPSSVALGSLIFLGVVPTGIAYILRFYLINKVGYSTFSLSVNMIPVFGVFLGYVLLDEPLSLQVVLALVLVVIGLFVTRSGGGPAKAPEKVKQ